MYYSKLIDFIEYKELVIRDLGIIFNFLPFQAQCKLFLYYSQHGNEPPEIREFDNVSLRDEMFSGLGLEHRGGDAHVEPGVCKPLVFIMEAEDSLHVVVEMAGITREDISLEISGTMLNIKAGNGGRKYSERVELPVRVLADLAKTTYKNGVLELVFKYDRSDKKSIKVD